MQIKDPETHKQNTNHDDQNKSDFVAQSDCSEQADNNRQIHIASNGQEK